MTRLLESALRRGYESGTAFKALQSYGAAGPVTISDDFNRADGLPGSNWTYDTGNFSIVSNKLQRNVPGGSGNDYAFWNTPCTTDDQYAQADVTGMSTQFIVLNLRGSGNITPSLQTYYEFFFVPTGSFVRISKVVLGSETNIVQLGVSHGNAHKIRAEAVGTALRFYLDDVLVASATDSSITTGKYVGVNCSAIAGPVGTYDNFLAGDLAALSPLGAAFAGAGEIRSNTGNDFTHDVYTIVFAAYLTSATFQRTLVAFNNSTNSNPRISFDSGNIAIEHETGDYPVWFSAQSDATYYLGAITKGTGTVAPKLYLTSNGTTWTYDGTPADAGTAPNPSASITDIWLGCTLSTSNWNGEIAAIALANTEASAATIHGLLNFDNWSLLSNLRFFTGKTLKFAGTMNDTGSGNNDETSRTGVTSGVHIVPSWLTNF